MLAAHLLQLLVRLLPLLLATVGYAELLLSVECVGVSYCGCTGVAY